MLVGWNWKACDGICMQVGGGRGNDRREEGCVMCSWEGIISGRRVCSLSWEGCDRWEEGV